MWSVTCFLVNRIEIVANVSTSLETRLEISPAVCQVASVSILDLKSRD